MAGGIQALFVSYVTVGETFSIMVPLSVVLMSVLGGTRHWLGPAVGAAAVTALLYVFTAGNYPIAGRAAMGVIFVVVVLFLPNGLLGRFIRPGRGKSDVSPASAPIVAAVSAKQATPQSGTEPLLALRGVGKSFAGLRAVDGVSLDVHRGEILCLVGPNGSGKSTLINLVSGHYKADSGQIVFGGRNIAGTRCPSHRARRNRPDLSDSAAFCAPDRLTEHRAAGAFRPGLDGPRRSRARGPPLA